MRWFETRGPVYPENNYVVARTEELSDFVSRLEKGRYIVLFAPRQTGKTTLFRNVLDALEIKEPGYIPIHMNFEIYVDSDATVFYKSFSDEICQKINDIFQGRSQKLSDELKNFLTEVEISDPISLNTFFQSLGNLLKKQRIIIVIDEFDAIPKMLLRVFYIHFVKSIFLE